MHKSEVKRGAIGYIQYNREDGAPIDPLVTPALDGIQLLDILSTAAPAE